MRVSAEEPVEGSYKLTGAFEVRQVVAIGDYRQGASPEAGGSVPGLGLREHPGTRLPTTSVKPSRRGAVHQHLALARRVHLGAGHGQSGFQVARREGQPALLRQLSSWDACGVAKSSVALPWARW
jgi:hypothetical protein